MLRKALALSIFLGFVRSDDLTIKSMGDFTTFTANVATYSTVYLDTDLDFDGLTFTPIDGFKGTFDGQGHIIKNLKIESSDLNIGFFKTLTSSKVYNLIIDSTCSMKGTVSPGSALDTCYIGSVVGKALMCEFKNIINWASISFDNNGYLGNLYLGGIAGEFSSDSSSAANMINVANYGSVTSTLLNDDTKNNVYIGVGAFSGYTYGDYGKKVTFENCLNYGSITNMHKLGPYAGTGLVGVSTGYTTFNRVVSGVSATVHVSDPVELTDPKPGVIGVGHTQGGVTIDAGYVLPGVNIKDSVGTPQGSYGEGTGSLLDFTYSTSEFGVLNTGSSNDLKVWYHNTNEKDITFKINDNTGVVFKSKIILSPFLTKTRYTFSGWYTDEDCLTKLDITSTIDEAKTLYGGWQFTVTFNLDGGSITTGERTKQAIYTHKIGTFPELQKEGYSFVNWYDAEVDGNVVSPATILSTPSDMNVYARWSINQYNITFNYNNGTEATVNYIDFGGSIVYPPDPTWAEHIFKGWSDDYTVQTMPSYNLKVNATWELKKYKVIIEYTDERTSEFEWEFGAPIVLDTPEWEGHSFLGWENFTSTVPSGGITITGLWDLIKYTVTVNFGNGTEPLVLSFNYSETITLPDFPRRKGYNCSNWYVDGNKGSKVPATMPARNIVVDADCAQHTYIYTFMNGGSKVDSFQYGFNGTLNFPKAPKKSLKKFKCWVRDGEDECDDGLDPPEAMTTWNAKYDTDVTILVVIIVVCVVVVIVIVVIVVVFLVTRKKKRQRRKVPKKNVEME